MRPEHFAAIIVRGVGLGLILFGLTATLFALPFIEPMASSGWTSYSPLNTTPTGASTSVVAVESISLSTFLPAVAQMIAGSALIWFGRPVGRWLAHGLRDDQD
jgi:hypothetical protein